MQQQRVKIVSLEGNIGAGKSTLITNMSKFFNIVKTEEKYNHLKNKVVFIEEPVHLWKEVIDPVSGKNMLELFYENPEKWSFAFQIMVITTQEQMIDEALKKNPECELIISERSLEAGMHIFTELLFNRNCISMVEYKIIKMLFDNRKYRLSETIYIKTDNETCFQRISKRARKGETGITFDYLQQCEYYYDNWLFKNHEMYAYPTRTHCIQSNNLHAIIPLFMNMIDNL
jgi:deoxyadenosine/deoxycytidine kinase